MVDVNFDFGKMIDGLKNRADTVQSYLDKLEQAQTSSAVQLTVMFKLQFSMQLMSQYMEATSNCLSAVHNEMMTMARATKGQ